MLRALPSPSFSSASDRCPRCRWFPRLSSSGHYCRHQFRHPVSICVIRSLPRSLPDLTGLPAVSMRGQLGKSRGVGLAARNPGQELGHGTGWRNLPENPQPLKQHEEESEGPQHLTFAALLSVRAPILRHCNRGGTLLKLSKWVPWFWCDWFSHRRHRTC